MEIISVFRCETIRRKMKKKSPYLAKDSCITHENPVPRNEKGSSIQKQSQQSRVTLISSPHQTPNKSNKSNLLPYYYTVEGTVSSNICHNHTPW